MARDHPLLVQHSQFHTQAWRANGDISLILSKSSPDNPSVDEIIATEKYITGYACKGNEQTGAVAELFKDIVSSADESAGATGKSVCTKLLMNTVKRDISSMEATYELTSLPLFRCNHQFQSISFTGSRVLEAKGHTLTKATPLDRYLARPEDQNGSWYQFICRQGKVPVISGVNMHAVWPLDEDYSRSMLLLHWPNWRKINDIKHPDLSWKQLFENFLASDECPNFVKADVERAKRHQSPELSADQENDVAEEEVVQPSWMDLLKPIQEFQTDEEFLFDDGGPDFDWSVPNEQFRNEYPSDLGIKWLENMDVNIDQQSENISIENLLSLNNEQKFVFNLALSTLVQYQEVSQKHQPLRLVVSGTAGTGKSFLIKCIVFAIKKLFDCNSAVQVVCPTGNSANLIAGRTIHDFLKIPTGHKLKKDLTQPEGVLAEQLQDNCRNLKALIVDERSLVGSTTLGWMEHHLKFALNNQGELWGGLPVLIFLGDDVQLPPVCDTPVFSKLATSPAAMHGALIWKEFVDVVHLQTMVRQSNDEHYFKEVLNAFRNYSSTPEHAHYLQQFQWSELRNKYGESVMTDIQDNGLYVFPTHDAEISHNQQCLKKANASAPVATVSAVNTGGHAKTAQSDKANGLQNILHICVGAKVMLTSNLAVSYGLFNGSIGVVEDIIYLEGRRPGDSLPDVVMVSFPKYSGPSFVPSNPKIVPIVPVTRRIDCFCKSCKRKQLPMRLGWGTTIHKCQGMTIGNGEVNRFIVIDPGKKAFESRNPGALFVALSRAKTAGNNNQPPDFAWHPNCLINEDRICHRVDTPTTKARDKEISRLKKLAGQTQIRHAYHSSHDVFLHILDMITSKLQSEE